MADTPGEIGERAKTRIEAEGYEVADLDVNPHGYVNGTVWRDGERFYVSGKGHRLWITAPMDNPFEGL